MWKKKLAMVTKFAILAVFCANLPLIFSLCYYDYTRFLKVNCNNVTVQNLISFNFYEGGVQRLHITNSNISILPSSFFFPSKFSKMITLELLQVHLKTIQPEAFTGLTNLEQLHLDNNELTVLAKGVFKSLHKLKILNLTGNSIYEIEKFALMDLVSLKKLNLKNNNLSNVEDDFYESVKRLTSLDMSGNPLNEFSSKGLITNLSYLTFLDLSSTQLLNLNFSHFPQVANLFLSNNRIETMNVTFDHVVELYMGHNQLQILEKSIFDNSKNVLTVDFSFNKISTIDKHVFSGLTSLKRLLLENNNITKLDHGLFRDLTSLTFLNLSHNRIKELEFGTFDTLRFLEILDISNNKLIDLHQYTFTSLLRLSSLYFDNNQISSFDIATLKGCLKSLTLVSLNHNPWECEKLVKISQYFEENGVVMQKGDTYDVPNFHGIPCSKQKIFEKQANLSKFDVEDFMNVFKKAIGGGVKNSEMERFFGENFKNSKFFQYFDKDYVRSNFFKYLDNYKFAAVEKKLSNDSKVERLTTLQVTPHETNNKIVIVSVVMQVIMSSILLFILILTFKFLKEFRHFGRKSELLPHIEL